MGLHAWEVHAGRDTRSLLARTWGTRGREAPRGSRAGRYTTRGYTLPCGARAEHYTPAKKVGRARGGPASSYATHGVPMELRLVSLPTKYLTVMHSSLLHFVRSISRRNDLPPEQFLVLTDFPIVIAKFVR
jgi:hypothetical protein